SPCVSRWLMSRKARACSAAAGSGTGPSERSWPLADGTEAYAPGAADDPPGVVSQPETHNPDTATASNRGVMRDFRCWRRVISRLSKIQEFVRECTELYFLFQ